MSLVDKVQIGGSHYKEGGTLQHWNMAAANGLGYLESASTKYVTRWRKKAGLLDLEKAGHYHDKLMELAAVGAACPVQTHVRREGIAGILRVDMDSYADANGLGFLEREYCRLVVDWSDTGDLTLLERSKRILVDLLKEATRVANHG